MSHDRLIAEKFPDKGERQTVHALISALPRTMKPDHVTALIHELAAAVPDGQTGQQSAAYIASFLNAIGAMDHERDAFTRWIEAGGPGAFFNEPVPAPDVAAADGATAVDPDAAPTMRAAPPMPTGPTRADLEAQIQMHERNMRAEPGSDAWRDYWTRGGSTACLDARRALEVAPTPLPAAEPTA